MDVKGIIFDIKRFSLHDGPGIRTTIFFKGCSLRCKWCHNPESISPLIQLKHNPKKCILCGKCVSYVGDKSIEIVDQKLNIDFSIHNQNFDLIDICPVDAYSKYGSEYDIEELVDIILKDKDYYDNSGGGVTLSGGEALNQFNFIKKLSNKLKEYDINICLDLSGYDPANKIKDTLGFVDTYLLDYKLSSKEDFENYVGKYIDLTPVLKLLEKNNKNIILRCPIIPAVNDQESHFKKIAELSKKYKNIVKVDILAYHNMIKNFNFKYENEQQLFDLPSEAEKKNWESSLLKYGAEKTYLNHKKIGGDE